MTTRQRRQPRFARRKPIVFRIDPNTPAQPLKESILKQVASYPVDWPDAYTIRHIADLVYEVIDRRNRDTHGWYPDWTTVTDDQPLPPHLHRGTDEWSEIWGRVVTYINRIDQLELEGLIEPLDAPPAPADGGF